jgi:hypothetical protein
MSNIYHPPGTHLACIDCEVRYAPLMRKFKLRGGNSKIQTARWQFQTTNHRQRTYLKLVWLFSKSIATSG